jgi:hypothetical protein
MHPGSESPLSNFTAIFRGNGDLFCGFPNGAPIILILLPAYGLMWSSDNNKIIPRIIGGHWPKPCPWLGLVGPPKPVNNIFIIELVISDLVTDSFWVFADALPLEEPVAGAEPAGEYVFMEPDTLFDVQKESCFLELCHHCCIAGLQHCYVPQIIQVFDVGVNF